MSLRRKLLTWLGGVDKGFAAVEIADAVSESFQKGFALGKMDSKTHWRILPLPFTDEQLNGRSYGEFITPYGFAGDAFGECSVPGCGPHGYEQKAMYVARDSLDKNNPTLTCHAPAKFDKDKVPSDALVPVIVTLLR